MTSIFKDKKPPYGKYYVFPTLIILKNCLNLIIILL